MADEHVDFQSATPATPPAGTQVGVDLVGGIAYQRVKLDGGGDGVLIPLVAGRNADAASLPVALSSEDVAILNAAATSAKQDTGNTSLSTLAGIVSSAKAAVKSAIGDIADLATLLTNVGALTETAPATDTASSGLNGRLQRIAQRITSLIALLPTALGSGGGLKVDGSGTALPVSGSVTATVSGSVTANAGTNLNTSALALDASLSTTNTEIGGLTETAPATDTASSGLNGRLQRIAQRLSSIIALLPSALVGGKFSVTTATTITPTWAATTTAVLTPQMLAKGAVPLVGTVAVTSLKGGYLKVRIFRSGATAIDVAIQVRVRRLTGDSPPKYFDIWYAYTCGKTTAVAGVAAGSGNNAGVTSLTLNAAKTFAAGPNGDIQLGVIDNTTTPTTASELLRQAFPTSTTVKVLEFPTQSAHNNTAHVVCDQAEALSIWLDGGESYSLSIDYASATTGDSVYVDAYFNPYQNDGAS